MPSYLIYRLTAPNGKAYIGQTNNLQRRLVVHRNTNGCRALASAIAKHGWDAFAVGVLLDGLTLEEANEAETRLIAEHKTVSPRGYNLASGGGNFKHSPESIERMRQASAQRPPASEATRQKIAATMRNRPELVEPLIRAAKNPTPETRAKISAYASNRPPEVTAKISATLKGRKATNATKAKQSAARTGRRNTEATKAKMSASAKARAPRTFSAEARANMAAAHRARWARIRAEKQKAREGASV